MASLADALATKVKTRIESVDGSIASKQTDTTHVTYEPLRDQVAAIRSLRDLDQQDPTTVSKSAYRRVNLNKGGAY